MKKIINGVTIECDNCILPINLSDCVNKVKGELNKTVNPEGLIDTHYYPKKNLSNSSYTQTFWHCKTMYLSMIVQSKNMEQLNECDMKFSKNDFDNSLKFWLNKLNCKHDINDLINETHEKYDIVASKLLKKYNDENFEFYAYKALNENYYNSDDIVSNKKNYKITVCKNGSNLKKNLKADYFIPGTDIMITFYEMHSLRKEFIFHGIKNIRTLFTGIDETIFNRLYENLRVYKKRNKDEVNYIPDEASWIGIQEDLNSIKDKLSSITKVNVTNIPECAETAVQDDKINNTYKPTSNDKVTPECAQNAKNIGEEKYAEFDIGIRRNEENVSNKEIEYRTSKTGITYKYNGINFNE